MSCPHCNEELIPHEGGGAKEGALHCYGCGCCFLEDGTTPRPGVPLCALAQAPAEPSAEPEPDADEEAPETAEAKPRRSKK